jgi:hypothetical protein
MLEINEAMFTTLLETSAMIFILMAGIAKPFLKTYAPKVFPYVARILRTEDTPENRQQWLGSLFRVITIGFGIVFVAANDEGMYSLIRLWRYSIPDGWLWLDIIATGTALGLGSKILHEIRDFGAGAGSAMLAWMLSKANHEVN